MLGNVTRYTMARVRLLEKEEADLMVKEIYQKVEDGGGRVINLLKALAHSPKICRDWNRLGITCSSRAGFLQDGGNLPSFGSAT